MGYKAVLDEGEEERICNEQAWYSFLMLLVMGTLLTVGLVIFTEITVGMILPLYCFGVSFAALCGCMMGGVVYLSGYAHVIAAEQQSPRR